MSFTLEECLYKLSVGELSNLAMSNNGDGTIREQNIPHVVNAINEALTRLYSLFCLKKKTVVITVNPNQSVYIIDEDTSISNAAKYEENEKYYLIDKEGIKHINDFLYLEEIRNDRNLRIPVNSPDPHGAVLLAPNVIKLLHPEDTTYMTVFYRADHKRLIPEEGDQIIEIPKILEGAFTAYVAYQVYGNINTQEGVQNAQKYFQMFQNIIQQTVEEGLIQKNEPKADSKFYLRGWV